MPKLADIIAELGLVQQSTSGEVEKRLGAAINDLRDIRVALEFLSRATGEFPTLAKLAA